MAPARPRRCMPPLRLGSRCWQPPLTCARAAASSGSAEAQISKQDAVELLRAVRNDTEKCELNPDTCPAHYEGCMVQGRNDTPLSKLLVAEEVKRAGLRDTEVIALRLYSGNFLHATAS